MYFSLLPSVPVGLEDVSKYPALFAELISRGYSDDDLQKVARLNLIRVFSAVEEVCMYSKTCLRWFKTATSLVAAALIQ